MNKYELFEYIKKHPNGNVQENIFKKKYPEHYEHICKMVFPDDFTFQQKLFHYFNDDYELKIGICPVCGNRCKYRRINEGYNKHCSTTCSSNDCVVKDKLKSTNIEKYGFEYSSKNPDVKYKTEQTNILRYGFDNPAKSDVVKNKMIATNLERYGKSNYSQTNLFNNQHKKRILYNDIYFDSSWEVILYRYCILTNKCVEYNPNILIEYVYDDKVHYYQPDFLIDGALYEVKGTHFFDGDKMINPYDHALDGLYEAKHKCMIENEVKIITESEINLMKNKIELFEYLNTIDDKSGGFKKEESIKKNYPEIYDGIVSSKFPEYWTFTQKLWHYLKDDFSIHRCKCGNELHFIDFKRGYRTYCSRECPCGVEHNKTTLQKAQIESRKQESRKKAVDTILEKNGGKFWSDENLDKLKRTYNEKREQIIEKRKNTIIENLSNAKYLYDKQIKGVSSQVEMDFYKYLINIFGVDNVDPQHFDKSIYPYACDFYISNADIYIEINGTWTHGKHPYDDKSPDDIKIVQDWKSKSNEYYDNAIYTWTDLDVRKRKKAKSLKLNYLEIFSNNFEECVSIFEKYILDMIVEYCLSVDFPGNSKWEKNHPIWKCNVGKQISPFDAWKKKEYIVKCVKNIFSMIYHDDKFKKRHIREFLLCKIIDNKIVDSRKQFLERILDRFTIAKIAPKVTALSKNEMNRIIDESGIDISNGVYIPMAGFGGIVEGCRMWGENHNVEIEIEAYDINKNFCDWYGWSQRDMLKQKVKTDKVCICCPPFGKKFEHWDGTPNEMSNISFNDWYKLIKEYVDAPEYIIIGPEIGGKENAPSLFKKKVGIMRYTDEMIN